MPATTFLASYPKSGNTWVRALATCLLGNAQLDSLTSLVGESSNRANAVSALAGCDAALLTLDALDELRCSLFQQPLANNARRLEKTHSHNRTLPSGRRFASATAGSAIAIVRHPFDVAISYSHFIGRSVDHIIDQMTNEHAVLDRVRDDFPTYLPQTLSSWASNVASWCVDPSLPTMIVRYEDLVAAPDREVKRLSRFLGLDATPEAVDAAIEASSFARLRQLEDRDGFDLTTAEADRFFRAGVSGDGTHKLTVDQRARLHEMAGETMLQLGYHSDGSAAPNAVGI